MKKAFLWLTIIIASMSLLFQSSSIRSLFYYFIKSTSDFTVHEFKNYIGDIYYNNEKKLVFNLDVKNTDIIFESTSDYDDGAIIGSKDFDEKFSVDYDKDNACISIKNKYDFTEKNKITFSFVSHKNSNVDFCINLDNGDLKTGGMAIDFKSISCNIRNGKVIGDILRADSVILNIDNVDNILIKRILCKEKTITQI